MIISAAALIIAALSLLYNFVFKGIRSENEYISSANALIFAGDNNGAVKECAAGLGKYPQSVELYFLKSRAYLLMGDVAKAIGTLDMGYKQTQNAELLEQRDKIDGEPINDAEFVPLKAIEDSSETSDVTSDTSDVSSVEVEREPYIADRTISVRIPNVRPPDDS